MDKPAVESNIIIIIIWYRTAIKGSTPDNICPVIIPGSETKPTASNELIWGIMEALNEDSLALMNDECWISFSKRSMHIEIEFIVFANIIPPIGIIILGSYTFNPNTKYRTKIRLIKDEENEEKSIME